MFKKSTLHSGGPLRFHAIALLLIANCQLLIVNSSSAQTGGGGIYSFLDIPASARIAAMGGTLISIKDDDLNCALQNPAALNPSMDNYLSFSEVNLQAGIKLGDAAYAKDFKNLGTFDIWMHYASYGNFQLTDATGAVNGSFTAADYALSLGWGYQLNPLFSIGANIKGIYSDYYIEKSTGLSSDFGVYYADSTLQGILSGFSASIVARNIGVVLKPYIEGNVEPVLPPEAMFSFSIKPKHAPFRGTFIYHHMEKFDLTFIDPNDPANYDALTGAYSPQSAGFWKKFLEHWTPALELILSNNFYLIGSYNVQRYDELSISTSSGISGISFGAGIKISKFMLTYAHSGYNLAGGSNHFSIAANLSEFARKK